MKTAALYARVSTRNHDQNPESQLLALREYAARRGFVIFHEYVDNGVSGSKAKRPALDQLMKDAKLRRFDAVVVWRFSRFARSVKHLVLALEEFKSLEVDFISLSESIDTTTPMGKMIFVCIGAFAEFELDVMRENIQLGLERARKEGKHLGRPWRICDRDRVRQLRADGLSLRQISKTMKIPKDTISRLLHPVAKTSSRILRQESQGNGLPGPPNAS